MNIGNGDYLLIKLDKGKHTVVVKLDCEHLMCEGCLTSQPKWQLCKIVYSDSDCYIVGDKSTICLPYINELDYTVISEEKALAMAI